MQELDELTDLPDLEELDLMEEPTPKRRGPRPKARQTSAGRSPSSSSASREKPKDQFAPAWEKELRKGYRDAMVLVGGASMLLMPVTGTVVVHRAEPTADVLVRLARTDERIRAALLAVLRYGTFLELLTIVGSIGLAVNVDFWIQSQGKRGIKPDNPAVGLLIGQEVQQVIAAIEQQSGSTPPAANGAPVAAGWAPTTTPTPS